MRKAKPDNKSFEDLIYEIEKGKIKIPQFQRDFVWTKGKTAKLLDSILKGFPIGTFILWETNERMNDVKNIGNIEFPRLRKGQSVEYILDGQQRISSLYAAYRGVVIPSSGGNNNELDYGEIFVDLTKKIEDNDEQVITSEKPESNFATLNDVLNVLNRYDELKKHYSKKEMEKLISYCKIFIDYQFSTVILKQSDINSAIEVFTRINTSGQVLTLFEIMAAKTYDESKNFDMSQKWEEYNESLEEVGYEGISSSIILNLLSLVISRTRECKRSTILKLNKNKIINNWDKATNALNMSIDYFRKNNIPVSKLLPYDMLLVPFAYFFFETQKPGPTIKQKKLLEEFFWRVSLSFRYSSATESKLAQDIKRIDDIIKGVRPPYKDVEVLLNKSEDLIERDFRAGNSYCKAILCLLSQKIPRNFKDDSKVILDNSYLVQANSRNFHHFFPKSFLKKRGIKNENSMMNITLIGDYENKKEIKTQAPATYIKRFARENNKIKKTLQSHFISLTGYGIENNKYQRFLKKRASRIFRELNKRMNP